MQEAIQEILEQVEKRNINNQKELDRLKAEISHKHKLKQEPRLIHLFLEANKKQRKKFSQILKTKPVRTISGVAPIALFTMPSNCPPQAKCIYCPGGVNSFFGTVPKSYTGNEPASRRAARNKYDPYLQIFNRLEHYALLNQNFDKADIIIMGGTFPFYSKPYKDEFITYVYKALNDFSEIFFKNSEFQYEKFKKFYELPTFDIDDRARIDRIHKKLLKLKNKSTFKKEQLRNENSKIRCIGLTIETRPDLGKLEEGNEILYYGGTKIELGIQSVYDEDLVFTERGHLVKDSIDSIRILKDLGFKLNFHYMLGLNSDRKKDLDGLKTLFSNPDFRPDMMKIYPCLVMPGTKLHELYKKKEYKPITTEEAVEIISEAKRFIPEYVRIMRVQRDIPTFVTVAGPDRTNLRQIVEKKCQEKNIKCNCIRCREIKNEEIVNPKLNVLEYDASKGKEFFISYKSNDKIIGFCRLRFPSQVLRKEITDKTALIRELHVYSSSAEIGKKPKASSQHKGFGQKLIKKAEEISLKNNKNKILILSGIGVKQYYKEKLGYEKEGPYMSKILN